MWCTIARAITSTIKAEVLWMFEESPNSKLVWDYFNRKYGQMIAPIGLVKVCSILSACLKTRYTFNAFVVAPTRQFKSITSIDASSFLPKSMYLHLGSDFTIHSLEKHYGKVINKKCLIINDGTLLLSSKSKRTKDRLVNGLAELLSEGIYKYGERTTPEILLEGRVSILMNMTSESYEQYKDDLLGKTFTERFLTFFYGMPIAEQRHFISEKLERMKISNSKKLKISRKKADFGLFLPIFQDISERFSVLACQAFMGVDDQVKTLAEAHCCLNGREKICQDDVDIFSVITPYMNNPFAPNEHKIIGFAKQGRSQKDICLLLNKTSKGYKSYVSDVIKKARLRGIVA